MDSQSDPAKAAGAYAEAVEGKGIQAGVLNWHSSVAIAVMDVAAQYKVPHMFGFGAMDRPLFPVKSAWTEPYYLCPDADPGDDLLSWRFFVFL